MTIARVDLFYLAMPQITTDADGTQDTFLVRLRDSIGIDGWGECDASPLVTLAAYVCPRSHGNINPLREILLGQPVEEPADVVRLHDRVLREALDVGQVHHALSAADIALWDLLGKKLRQPVWQLLQVLDGSGAAARPAPKLPYASVLFAETPDDTRRRAQALRQEGFSAVKLGWGPMGRHGESFDVALVEAARDGLGPDPKLLVDAGVAWGEDAEVAYRRAEAFAAFDIGWLEEPLHPGAVKAYARLQSLRPRVPIAAGEGARCFRAAEDLVENGRVDYIQVDAGRIGGITTAFAVRRLAERVGCRYVNHTFKSRLSLAAALHVFATAPGFELLEYPARASCLAQGLVPKGLERDADGLVRVPAAPGLGVDVDPECIREFLRPARIEVGGEVLFSTGTDTDR